MNIKKFLINNKQVTIFDDSLVYMDTDFIVDNKKDFVNKLNFVNNKIAYVDVNYPTEKFTLLKLIFCKTRLHIYLCNVVLKLNVQIDNFEEIYTELEKVLDKVIT